MMHDMLHGMQGFDIKVKEWASPGARIPGSSSLSKRPLIHHSDSSLHVHFSTLPIPLLGADFDECSRVTRRYSLASAPFSAGPRHTKVRVMGSMFMIGDKLC